jgi:hypothetical protein
MWDSKAARAWKDVLWLKYLQATLIASIYRLSAVYRERLFPDFTVYDEGKPNHLRHGCYCPAWNLKTEEDTKTLRAICLKNIAHIC